MYISRFLKPATADLALMLSTTYHATLAVNIWSRPITLAGQALPTKLRKPWLADGLTTRVTLTTAGISVPSLPIFYSSHRGEDPQQFVSIQILQSAPDLETAQILEKEWTLKLCFSITFSISLSLSLYMLKNIML